MGEWKEYKLGEIIKIVGGGTPKTSECRYWNGNIPWLSVVDFNNDRKYVYETEKHISIEGLNNSSTKILSKGDIIISARGTVGAMAMLGKDMAFNQSCYGIQPTKLVDRDYLYYLLFSSVQELKHNSHGGVFDTITRDTFDTIEILLPPLSEQKRIVSILGSLDDKIDLLHRENETLEAMAETFFRKLFIEDAKEICKTCKISDVIDFNPHRKLFKGTNSLFLEMTNLNTSTYCPKAWYNKEFTSGTKFINGDTLLARITPCLENGKTAYIDILKEKQVGWGSTEFIIMRPKLGLHPFFAYILAKYQDFRDFAESCMSGSSGRQRVDIENLKNYDFRIPNKRIIDMFNDSIIPIISKMKNNNNEIFSLRKMRDILLHKLMLNEIK